MHHPFTRRHTTAHSSERKRIMHPVNGILNSAMLYAILSELLKDTKKDPLQSKQSNYHACMPNFRIGGHRSPSTSPEPSTPAAMRLPRLYLGTMTFAWNQSSSPVDDAVARAFLQKFVASGGKHVDTARIYAAGETEPMLGRALTAVAASDLLIGSKAAPSQPGGLSAQGMRNQLDKSLAAIGVDGLAEYYLHQPDTEAALLESLREAHAMVQEGKIGAVGMSNYHADEMARAFALCEEHGLTKPSVYQGLYNPLNRAAEDALLPLLRSHGCSFVAYNPLAAGLLSGKHRPGVEVPAGRFKDNPNYLPRFYTDGNFAALQTISAACDAAGLSVLDATYCWLLRHSALTEADGLLVRTPHACASCRPRLASPPAPLSHAHAHTHHRHRPVRRTLVGSSARRLSSTSMPT